MTHRAVNWLVVAIVSLLVIGLQLLMGNRTPETLAFSGLVITGGAFLIALFTFTAGLATENRISLGPFVPPPAWWIFGAAFSALILLQVAPIGFLAQALGPYPEALWLLEFQPAQWSPNPAYTLRAWAVFVALASIAWWFSRLGHRKRNAVWLVVTIGSLAQALYGLVSHAAGSETILGVWPRNNPDYVHGTFSNRNLFAAYLALTWPLVIAIWWKRDVPLLRRLPFEMRVTGSVICGAILGAALLASASRLGSAAGLVGLLVGLVLWTQYAKKLSRVAVWPMYATAIAALIAATWYGLTPLAERLAVTSIEEGRFELYTLMVSELPKEWWLWGVGLGGFEAVFKQVQPADMTEWIDYAHNDLLQWLLEMGLVGAGLLIAAAIALIKNARLTRETLPLYSGLAALCLVALGDFSWHIPATQIVLALYLGVLLTPAHQDRRERSHRPSRSGVTEA